MEKYGVSVRFKLGKVKTSLLCAGQQIYRFTMSNRRQKRGQASFIALAGIGFSVVLSACGGSSGADAATTSPVLTPPSASIPSPSTIARGTWVVIGSSTAAGGGAPAGKGWVDVLQALLATRITGIVNLALPGSVTYQGLSSSAASSMGRPSPDPARNIDQSLSRNPVAVIVAYPTNDVVAGYGLEEIVKNILSIRETALRSKVPVLVLSTQPRKVSDDKHAELMAVDARLSAAIGSCYVDVYTKLATQGGQLMAQYDSGDGAHPNEAGHQIIAASVQQVIDSGKCVVLQ